jgi:hypothetical protein
VPQAFYGSEIVSRDEIIAAIQKCAEELGHPPTAKELLATGQVGKYAIRSNFGCYRKALEACGLERHGTGYKVNLESLFPDWAGVVRRLEKVPTIAEYELHGKYSHRPLIRHFGGWHHVPPGMRDYAREAGLKDTWGDVLEVVARHLNFIPGQPRALGSTTGTPLRPLRLADGPVYGLPMMAASPMVYAPTNEAGVMVLFGAVAREQGFAITRVQQAFPDCEAMREIEPERCQPTRIEFEFESRNFLVHLHPVDGCDMIVCWKHNWPECPLEVLELSTMTWHAPGERSPSSP